MRHLATVPLLLAACADVGKPTEPNPEEVITTVLLAIGGAEYAWTDPENDGAPVIDPILLAPGAYPFDVRFQNGLEDPPEEITEEVAAESDEHQVFFTGSAVADGVVVVVATDLDENGLPIGLTGELTASVGAGELTVTLRHLPPESDVAVKTADLTEAVAADGVDSIGGSTDAEVTFAVTVE